MRYDKEEYMPINPISKTYFKPTKDRLQHFTLDYYICTQCNNKYQAKIHSQPYIVQFGAILLGLSIVIFLLLKSAIIFYVYGAACLTYLGIYANKKRKAGVAAKTKYGDIILECPSCGCTDAKLSSWSKGSE